MEWNKKNSSFTFIQLLISVDLAGVVGMMVASLGKQLNTSSIQQRFEAKVEESVSDLNVKLAKKTLCESNVGGEAATQANASGSLVCRNLTSADLWSLVSASQQTLASEVCLTNHGQLIVDQGKIKVACPAPTAALITTSNPTPKPTATSTPTSSCVAQSATCPSCAACEQPVVRGRYFDCSSIKDDECTTGNTVNTYGMGPGDPPSTFCNPILCKKTAACGTPGKVDYYTVASDCSGITLSSSCATSYAGNPLCSVYGY